jgi:chemotaxis signal transduction protein
MDMDAFRPAPDQEDLAFLTPEITQTPRYVFRSGDCNFLLPIGQRAEILLRPTLYFFPLAPKALLGICNIRSQAVPVFDPFPSAESETLKIKQLLFFSEENDGFALRCEAVRLIRLPAQLTTLDPKHFSPSNLQAFMSAVFFFNDEIYLVCNWPSWIESLYDK